MVIASLLFMQRMAAVTNVNAISRELEDGDEDDLATLKDPNAINRRKVPPGVEVYEINGPFFFGIADRLQDTLRGLERPPKVFILRMRRVPAIDATGLHALDEFHKKCLHQGTTLLLAGVHAQPLFAFMQIGFDKVIGRENLFESIDAALDRARQILGLPMEEHPADAAAEVRPKSSET
jgi:SulP family sulfate permease